MFRFIEVHLGNTGFSFSVDFVIQIGLLLALFIFLKRALIGQSLWKILVLTLLPASFAGWGGSYLHFFMAGDSVGPIGVFGNVGQGQAYYGALFLQALSFWILSVFLLRKSRLHIFPMDLFAVASPFIYAGLRLACLANGCCYGKLCPYPWAIRFKDEHSLTPLLGLPLHPTQIYGMIHGLILGGILITLYQRRKEFQVENRLFALFLFGMGLGRLIIDPFRAGMKGEIWHGWTGNQWISWAILLGVGMSFILSRLKVHVVRKWLLSSFVVRMVYGSLVFSSLLSVITMSGCSKIAQPPGVSLVSQTTHLDPSVLVHKMSTHPKKEHLPAKNLLFVAVDDFPDDLKSYSSLLSKVYTTSSPPRMEEVLWWYYAPSFVQLYQEVVRIQYDGLNWAHLSKAFEFLENQKIPFDLVLLVHGIPNHLVSSKKQPPIAWKDFQTRVGPRELKHLNLVYLQACFGDTLAPDLITMGAGSVISFHEFHNNVLYFDLFFKKYLKQDGDVDLAFAETNATFQKKLSSSLIYSYIVQEVLGQSVESYMKEVQMPRLMMNLNLPGL